MDADLVAVIVVVVLLGRGLFCRFRDASIRAIQNEARMIAEGKWYFLKVKGDDNGVWITITPWENKRAFTIVQGERKRVQKEIFFPLNHQHTERLKELSAPAVLEFHYVEILENGFSYHTSSYLRLYAVN